MGRGGAREGGGAQKQQQQQQMQQEEVEWELGWRADVPVCSWEDAVVINGMVCVSEDCRSCAVLVPWYDGPQLFVCRVVGITGAVVMP